MEDNLAVLWAHGHSLPAHQVLKRGEPVTKECVDLVRYCAEFAHSAFA